VRLENISTAEGEENKNRKNAILKKMKMKKSIAITLVIASLLFSITACNNSSTKATSEEPTIAEATIYTCPMHPEIQADKPGDCPKCGMPLEKKETADTTQKQVQTDTANMK
jgi:hypothetical protein